MLFRSALTAGKPITVKDLMDSVMPQSPVVDSFITKKLGYRMSKSLDSMSKQLNINSSKPKMLNESDILIDDDIFENEE